MPNERHDGMSREDPGRKSGDNWDKNKNPGRTDRDPDKATDAGRKSGEHSHSGSGRGTSNQ